ncbi:MAG: MBL fold metallo-hydrolase [Steroidobacteraceae bacterium]|nr:MBL fold metallo-hydrolase [Steroidobacteraceae bacterium]MBP7013497.1 MBL fold metallo-hydrolase [Steroidobacteraceae bacterium]
MMTCGRALAVMASLCAPVVADAQTPASSTVSPPQPAADLRVQGVRAGLTVIEGAGGNVVVWSGADGVVLVDTGLATSSAALVEAVARISAAPVKFVIVTHGHADHAGGNEVFARKGAVLIGHESLRERGGQDPAVPSGNAEASVVTLASRPVLTTMDALALHLNGDRLDAVHVADAHTASDIVVRWNDADVVALGDIYWSGQYPYIDVESGGSLAGMVAAVEGALARSNARTVVIPGHGPVSNRAELAAYRDMLVAVGRKVREAVETGMGIEDILGTRPTAEFDAKFGRPGAIVAPEEFVRSVYRDLASRRTGR